MDVATQARDALDKSRISEKQFAKILPSSDTMYFRGVAEEIFSHNKTANKIIDLTKAGNIPHPPDGFTVATLKKFLTGTCKKLKVLQYVEVKQTGLH